MNKDPITYEGQTIDELKADFGACIDSYLAGCAELELKPGKAFSRS